MTIKANSVMSTAELAALLENEGETKAFEKYLGALRSWYPEGHAPSERFLGAVAGHRLELAKACVRFARYVGGEPGAWDLRDHVNGDAYVLCGPLGEVTIGAESAAVARSLIRDASGR